MQNHLLIHGDSLALPRDGVQYHETWPSRLRTKLDEWTVINRARDGKTTKELISDEEWENRRQLDLYTPRVVVLQLGIVDCAPRKVRKIERQLVEELESQLLRRISYFLATNFRSRSMKRAYVSPDEYRANLSAFVERAMENGSENVLFVKILSPSEKYSDQNKHSAASITQYNEILSEVADEYPIVDVLRPLCDDGEEERQIVDEYTLDDGYHLNPVGNERLGQRVIEHVNRLD